MVSMNSKTSLELLFEVSRELATTLDLHVVLSRLLFLSVKNVGAERGSIVVLNEKLEPVDAALVYGDKLLEHTTEQLQGIVARGLVGWVIENRQAVHIANTLADDRWLKQPDDAADKSGAKSAICLPLLQHENLAGVLTIVHPIPDFFSQDHLALLQAIAEQAGIAVYNARLYEELQAAHQNYRELFEGSIDPIVITDWEGMNLEVNRQVSAMTGLSEEEILSKTVFDLHKGPREVFDRAISTLHEGQTLSYESESQVDDDSSTPIEVQVRKVIFEGKENLQWILRDISERKTIEKLREDLGAMIYHDLRSPLSNVLTSLDMMKSIMGDLDPTLIAILAIVERSANRVQRLVNSLLDINRLETEQKITNHSMVDVRSLMDEVVEAVKPILDSKEQELSLSISDGIQSIWMDEDMIRRVLINLVENAIKYSPIQTHVRVKIDSDGQHVKFAIVDQGVGIPKEHLSMIFDPYFSTKDRGTQKGMGLGLTTTYSIINRHDGHITVESELGVGTIFTIYLPAMKKSLKD